MSPTFKIIIEYETDGLDRAEDHHNICNRVHALFEEAARPYALVKRSESTLVLPKKRKKSR